MVLAFSIAARPIGWGPGAQSAQRFLPMSVALVTMFFASTSTNACALVPVGFVGTSAEKAAVKIRADKERQIEARSRQRAFRTAVWAGAIDSADGLGVLLIPNVREWYADHSDCGPGGDGDGLPMPDSFIVREAFVSSELDGLSDDQLKNIVSATFLRAAIPPYRHGCSGEFRARFAQQLRITVPRRELSRAFVSLSQSGDRRQGLYRFADVSRATAPVAALGEPITRQVNLLADQSHPVTRALDDFWRTAGPQLRSPDLTCPQAYEQLVVARGAELDRIRSRSDYPQLVSAAAVVRKMREAGLVSTFRQPVWR